MYVAPTTRRVCEFKPVDLGTLVNASNDLGTVNQDYLATISWMSDLIKVANGLVICNRIDLASIENDVTLESGLWHPDKIGASGAWHTTRTLIAAYPTAPQVLGGVVQGLPDIRGDGGKRLANTPKSIIKYQISEAIRLGDAWEVDLDPESGYIFERGELHRTPPLEMRTEDRIVVSSILDYRMPQRLGIG